MAPCKMTPIRLAWLFELSKRGATPLAMLPRRAGTRSSPGYPTWGPMVAAGWIEELQPTRASMLAHQTWLRLTPLGHEVLAPYNKALIEQELGG